MNFTRRTGASGTPFWGTREFRWLVGILVLAGTLVGVVAFEILPLQRSLEQHASSLRPGDRDYLPRRRESRLPHDAELGRILDTCRDFTPVEAIDESYRALLWYLQKLPAPLLAEEALRVPHSLFAKSAKELRGKPFVVTALLIDWKPIALMPPEGDVEFAYRVYLLDPGGNEAYVVDLLEKLPAGLESKDLVRVEGLFWKLATYETRSSIVEAPMFQARTLSHAPRTQITSAFDFKTMAATLGGLSVVLLLMTIWFHRQASARRARPAVRPMMPTSAPASQPWEGFVERGWKSAVREARPQLLRRPKVEVTASARPAAAADRTIRWLILAGTACLLLCGWTAYRFWRDSRPLAPVVIDFDAESEKALSAATIAREAIQQTQQRAAEPSGIISATDIPLVEAALARLESNAVRLQDLMGLARSADPAAAQTALLDRSRKLLRLKLWILDASDMLDRFRAANAPGGFFLPLRLIASTRRDVEQRAGRPELASEEARQILARVDSALESCAKLEEYVKQGLARESLEPADLPELLDLGAERAALVKLRDLAARSNVSEK